MSVDDAGEHVQAARLDLVEGRAVSRINDPVEDPAGDQDVGFANAFFGDDASAADREICGRD